jgi:glycerol uptake facilitator-like aquaporin
LTGRKELLAEFLGTALLLVVVVGSGVMGERLAGGNAAVALLANAIATGAGLYVLIHVFGPISGAHFNPIVTGWVRLKGDIGTRTFVAYGLAQFAGAVAGVFLTHYIFVLPILQFSAHARDGLPQCVSEALATFGLLLTIAGFSRHQPSLTPAGVALYITGAYWFTSSTSFANPAVTFARMLTNTFAGIAPHSVPAFVAGQVLGLTVFVAVWRMLEDARA